MDEPARLPAVSISYLYTPTCEPLNGKDDSNRRLSHQALPGRLRICNSEAAARVSMCGNCKVSEGTRWIHILVLPEVSVVSWHEKKIPQLGHDAAYRRDNAAKRATEAEHMAVAWCVSWSLRKEPGSDSD